MVQAVAGATALQGRRVIKSGGTGEEHWRTDFLGRRSDGEMKDEPQAFLIEMSPNEVIVPHFHEVDQFQVFVAGGGGLGRNNDVAHPIAVHYADHHTGYGPINAGPQGFSYFTLRAKTDPGAVYLHKPGYREKLKPSRKRHHFAHCITLSTEPVLLNRRNLALEPLLENQEREPDGLGAFLLRMGPNTKAAGPEPRGTGGQYYLVVNGSLECGATSYSAWSTIFVGPGEAPLEVSAGPKGLEALILQYPRRDA
jgi:hypothetical protein